MTATPNGASPPARLLVDLLQDLDDWPPRPRPRAPLPTFARADAEKVGPHVHMVATRADDSPDVGHPRWEAVLAKRAILAQEAVAIAAAARGVGSRLLFLGGFSLSSYYPPGYLRQFDDLDLVVASEAELDSLLTALEERGYYVSRPATAVLRSRPEGTPPRLSFSLQRNHPQLAEPVILDVDLCGLPISPVSQLNMPQSLYDHPSAVLLDEGRIPVPGVRYSLLVLIADLYQRRHVRLRDLLDVDRLLRALESVEPVVQALRDLRMQGQVRRLAAAAEAMDAPELARRVRALGPRRSDAVMGGARAAKVRHIAARAWDESPSTAALRVSATVAEPLLRRLEKRAPAVALRLWGGLPPRCAFGLGLPLYLFPLYGHGRAPSSDRFPDPARPDRFTACGRRFLARWRPLLGDSDLKELGNGLLSAQHNMVIVPGREGSSTRRSR